METEFRKQIRRIWWNKLKPVCLEYGVRLLDDYTVEIFDISKLR